MNLRQLLEDNEFGLEVLPDKVHLYTLYPGDKFKVLGYLLPILVSDEFYSLTQSKDELSLILNVKHHYELSNMCRLTSMPDKYVVLRVYQESHGINEQGVVVKLAKFFSDNNVSILYVNSFNNNFILIPENQVDSCVYDLTPEEILV